MALSWTVGPSPPCRGFGYGLELMVDPSHATPRLSRVRQSITRFFEVNHERCRLGLARDFME